MVSIPLSHRSPKRSGRFLVATVAAVAVTSVAASLFAFRDALPWIGDDDPARTADLSTIFGGRGSVETIEDLERRVQGSPDDLPALLALSSAYLQAVRETGDPAYYARAGTTLDHAAEVAPADPDVFAAQAMLALGRHDFRLAHDFATQAVTADPERARYYGVLADAQVELGMYDEAVASLQEMVNRRPDFAAFSRIAYLRELYGDPEGAIEAMAFALEARTDVPENQAWGHTELARLYLGVGRFDDALAQHEAALAVFPGYPVALAGKGQVLAAQGDLDGAAVLFQKAFDAMPNAAYAIALGDIATVQGNTEEAARQYGLVVAIDELYTSNGSNTDTEMSLFLADHGSAQEAVIRARSAYEAAPSIHAADALAWSLYRADELAEARTYASEALRLGTREPLKLFHAATIELALGDETAAREHLALALSGNPGFSILYSLEAAATLARLPAP